jgi:CHAD domain-containing protein
MTVNTASPEVSPAQSVSGLLDHLGTEMHKAIKKTGPDAVHDVRVAIRRVRECLDVFSPAFPGDAVKKIDKKLSKVLKAAGELRNLDIAIELLKIPGVAKLVGLTRDVRRERVRQARDFADTLAQLDDGNVAEKWKKKLLKKAGCAVDPAKLAHKMLPKLAAEFFDAGEAAAGPLADPKSLHKFRIRSKRFRYAMELFVPLYGPELDDRMKILKNLQTLLGAINDCVATKDLLEDFRKKHREAVDAVKKKLDRKAGVRVRAFRSYWSKTLGPQKKDTWIQVLS